MNKVPLVYVSHGIKIKMSSVSHCNPVSCSSLLHCWICSQVTSCSTSPLRAGTDTCHTLLFPLLSATARAPLCVLVAWKSVASCLEYVPFSTVTDVFQRSPRASWRPSSTWVATRMWRRRRLLSGGCFPFTSASPPMMATLRGCPSPRGVRGESCNLLYTSFFIVSSLWLCWLRLF